MLSNLRYHTSVIISLFQSLGTLSISSRRLNCLSGYADRIHELIVISRELNSEDKTSLQRSGSRNYFSEADYVEFSKVKVLNLENMDKTRHWKIVGCSAYTGEGLLEGFDWLVQDMMIS
ncbi:ABC transporter D family member 1-like isoform X2 [Manihot esculenta]|uniref:ABC transporter D family member 1-like isoform X2 n=1 Tax=Manihot esculenta TaxID=3983 RepID=UPI001CC60228|nr:ABC transporter D family member 1-like isoform X2 [Manihot esculenta]XP_043817547.1 ABC transporter D family member 1-like isoform X2 [Manihot esculenta]